MTEMTAHDAILALVPAAEGLWIAPDGHGTPTIWQMRPRLGIGEWPTALLRSSEVNRTIWAVLSAVVPERAE